jgi:hypothetical protein
VNSVRLLGTTLLWMAMSSGVFALLGELVPEIGLSMFWVLVATFLAIALSMCFRVATRYPQQLSVVHVLVLVNAVSWMAYGVTGWDDGREPNTTAILLTFAQCLVGLSVLVIVFERLTRTLLAKSYLGWVGVLAERMRSMRRSTLFLLLAVYALLTAYRFSIGLVMSGAGGLMEDVTIIQSIILQLSSPVSGVVSVLGFLLMLGKDPKRRSVGIALVLIQVAFAFLGGRRGLLGLIALGGIVWIALRGMTGRRLLVVSGFVAIAVGVASPLFLSLREEAVRNEIFAVEAASRGAILAESLSRVVDEFTLQATLKSEHIENVQHRAGFLDWTVEIQQRVMQGWSVRYGEVAFVGILEAIPRFLFAEKFHVLGDFRVEQKVQIWFGMKVEDRANTVLGYAIADGGMVAVIIYFAAYGALLALVFRFLMGANFALSSLWAASTLFGMCFNVELGITDLFAVVRILVAVAVLDWGLSLLLGRRFHSDREAPGATRVSSVGSLSGR